MRLGRTGFLASWAVLVAIQLAPVMGWIDVSWLNPAPAFFEGWNLGNFPSVVLWMALWQLVKVAPTVGRMRDLGRADDDAVFGTLVPVANFYLFFSVCLRATPGEKRWKKLTARHRDQPTWFNSALPALGLMARTAAPGLLLTALAAIPGAILVDLSEGVVPMLYDMERSSRDTWGSGALGVAGFLSLYSILQLFKRQQATPISWVPTVLWLPSLMIAGLFAAVNSQGFGTLAPLHTALAAYPTMFLWYSFVGTVVVLGWVAAFEGAHTGKPLSLDGIWQAIRGRYVDTLAAYAARVQLVWLGAQVIVPGVFYWVYTAFVPMAGLLEDPVSHPLTARSGRLTWGMMSRLVKFCFIYAVLMTVVPFSVLAALEGPLAVQAVAMGDTSSVGRASQVAVEFISGLIMWWSMAVLYLMYKGRVVQLAGLQAEREQAKAAAAGVASGPAAG